MFATFTFVACAAGGVERCAERTSCERCIAARCAWCATSAACAAPNASAACLGRGWRQSASGCEVAPAARRELDGGGAIGGNRTRDVDALRALYVATGGAGWADRSGWLGPAPVCEWYGVGCDAGGAVASLVMRGNALSGTVPGEVGELASLGTLLLQEDGVAGMVPTQLGKLSRLSVLAFKALDQSVLQGVEIRQTQALGQGIIDLGFARRLNFLHLGGEFFCVAQHLSQSAPVMFETSHWFVLFEHMQPSACTCTPGLPSSSKHIGHDFFSAGAGSEGLGGDAIVTSGALALCTSFAFDHPAFGSFSSSSMLFSLAAR